MAKKKEGQEAPKFKSIEEKLNKTNPLYMAICENSKTCSQPSKHTDLGDMMLETCSHCMARRSWITKAELEKIEKAKLKEEEKAQKLAEKEAVKEGKKSGKTASPEILMDKAAQSIADSLPPMETIDLDIVDPSQETGPVNQEENAQIKKNAEEMQSAFAGIDQMVSNSGLTKAGAAETVKDVDEDYNPFDDIEDAVEIEEGEFVIQSFAPVSNEEVDLICDTANGKNRFKVRVTTSPEKIKTINENPNKIIGKKAKVEYKGLDDKGRPVEPNYLGFAK